jgi:hypothetical protein
MRVRDVLSRRETAGRVEDRSARAEEETERTLTLGDTEVALMKQRIRLRLTATSAAMQQRRRNRRRAYGLVAASLFTIVVGGAALAASGILDLGKPTNALSTNAYLPLGGFHRVNAKIKHGRKVLLLFAGTQTDAYSQAEEWPVVKALEQFGVLSDVTRLKQLCSTYTGRKSCDNPSFNLDSARYQSRYVMFVYADLFNAEGKCGHRLPPDEMAFLWHAGLNYYRPDPAHPCDHLLDYGPPKINVPVVLVGGYMQEQLNLFSSADLRTPDLSTGLSFDQVQQSLAQGNNPPGTTLVQDLNAETSVISAIICHADGRKPAAVCNRDGVRQTLKHVK